MSATRCKKNKYIVLRTFHPREEDPYLVYLRGEIFDQDDNLGVDHGKTVFSEEHEKTIAGSEDVAKLTDSEAYLLLAVTSKEERLRIFQERIRLDQGKALAAGSKVLVTLEGREFEAPGVVRYKGKVPSFSGVMFGVALLDQNAEDKIEPLNDIDLFVAVDKIRPRTEEVKNPARRHRSRNNRKKRGKLLEALPQSSEGNILSPERFVQVFEDSLNELERIFSIEQQLEQQLERLSSQKSTEFQNFRHLQQALRQIKEDYYEIKKSESNVKGMLAKEIKEREETEKLNGILEAKLAAETKAHEETKKCLEKVSQKLAELNKLEMSQDVLRGNERQFTWNESSSGEVVKEIKMEQQSSEELDVLFKCNQDETSQAAVQHGDHACSEDTRRITTIEKKQQSCEKLETLFYDNKKSLILLETRTLNTAQKKTEPYGGIIKQSDWTLKREEVNLTEVIVGNGSFGTVYKGTFRGTQVAVKKVKTKPIITEYNEENFRREMKMAARCRHPCMLLFIGATCDDESPLLVTELLDTSLKDVLLERALEPTEIKTIALDVAKGLNYLHLNQPNPIVHRDISSGNVLLWKHGTSWRGKVSDYGNAVMMNYAKTGSGGAIPYLAPELGNLRFSTKCDVYSYGVLLLEMHLRREPSCSDNREQLVDTIKDKKFQNVVRKCLKKPHNERPSMDDIISSLTD